MSKPSDKDRERALYWFGDERTTVRDVRELAAQFAAVRAEGAREERQRIVKKIREYGKSAPCPDCGGHTEDAAMLYRCFGSRIEDGKPVDCGYSYVGASMDELASVLSALQHEDGK